MHKPQDLVCLHALVGVPQYEFLYGALIFFVFTTSISTGNLLK